MELSKEITQATLATDYGAHAYKVAEDLQDAGYDTWWVGGGVRDMALGKIPKDLDIGTAATPEQIATVFQKSSDGGAMLGSMRVHAGKDTFEVTTFREDDTASDGRHPESVTFGTREKDAARRDLTVNALYWNPVSQELFDPTGGLKDLEEKLVRFIGAPGIRIRHDALRILRAVRFRALLDGQYHPDTYEALREQAALVEGLSGGRKLAELEKMLLNPRPERALEDLWELGVLSHISPELHKCKGIPQPADYHREGDVWDHTLLALSKARPDDGIDVRIAVLFHDTGKAETFSIKDRIRFDDHASVSGDIATSVLARLQMPKKRVEKIDWLIRHHMMMGTFFEMTDERKAHWYHHPWFHELLQLFSLDIAGTDPADYALYERIISDYHNFLDKHPRPQKPLLSGEDIMELTGIRPGEEVGKILKVLQDAQIRGEVTGKEEARAFILETGDSSVSSE